MKKIIKSLKASNVPEEEGNLREWFKIDLDGIKPKFIRIVAKNYGDLPSWHPAGAGNGSMLFSDEIIIK